MGGAVSLARFFSLCHWDIMSLRACHTPPAEAAGAEWCGAEGLEVEAYLWQQLEEEMHLTRCTALPSPIPARILALLLCLCAGKLEQAGSTAQRGEARPLGPRHLSAAA